MQSTKRELRLATDKTASLSARNAELEQELTMRVLSLENELGLTRQRDAIKQLENATAQIEERSSAMTQREEMAKAVQEQLNQRIAELAPIVRRSPLVTTTSRSERSHVVQAQQQFQQQSTC